MPPGTKTRWTPEDESFLISLRDSNTELSVMKYKLKRSAKAIYQRLHKLRQEGR